MLPTPEAQPPETPAVLEGARETFRGLGSMLHSASVPPCSSDSTWRQTVDTVSRSLLEATGFVPRRQPAQPKAKTPVFLAQGRFVEPAQEDSFIPTLAFALLVRNDWLIDDGSPEETDALWLALASAALFPLRDSDTVEVQEREGRRRGLPAAL